MTSDAPILSLENIVTVLGGGRAFLGKRRPAVRPAVDRPAAPAAARCRPA